MSFSVDPPLYRVRNWNDRHENNRTRELNRLLWLAWLIEIDTDHYAEIVDHDRGPGHLAVWLAVVMIAARCRPRGTLARETGKPHDAKSLARVCRLPADLVEEALPRLLAVGVLELVECDSEGSQPSADDPQPTATAPREGAGLVRRRPQYRYNREGEQVTPENGGAAAPRLGHAFDEFLQVFVAFGLSLSETDRRKVAAQWISLSPDDQNAAACYVAEQATGEWRTRESQYIPRPMTVLRERHWTRIPAKRTVSKVHPKDLAMKRATDGFLAEGGD